MKTTEQWMADNKEYGPKVRALLTKHGMFGHLDPGGAEITHPTHGKLRLSAIDEKEDYEEIIRFLQKHGIEDL